MNPRRIKLNSVWIVLLFTIMIVAGGLPAVAQKPLRVRGRIERTGDSKKNYPAAYTRVTLGPRAIKTRLFGTYTGSDGMFYFYVSPGSYALQVLGSDSKPIATYYIQVKDKNVDLAPIILP
jgi:hypothetical protein